MEYNYSPISWFKWQFNYTIDVRAWMSNYISQYYVNVITNPCPYFDAGLNNL